MLFVYLLLFMVVTWFSFNRAYVNSLTSLFDADIPPWLFVICSVFSTFPDQYFFTNVCLLFSVFLPFFGCWTDIQWFTQGAKYETEKLLSCIIVQKWAKNT